MNPIYHPEIIQGTPAWDEIRAGKWSASNAAKIMGGLETSGLADYVKDIAWGRVYGPTDSGFKSEAMKRGHEIEPLGRDWYAFTRDLVVEEIGFVEHGRIPHCGWSPDGLHSGRKHGIEAKSPLHKAWMETKRTGLVPSEYRWQCRFACFVGELDGLDFVSYHPKAGGLVVGIEVSEQEKAEIEARIELLEVRVEKWIQILGDRP